MNVTVFKKGMILLADHYPFSLKPLSYNPNDLAPYIEPETITLHHQVLQSRYVDALNAALAPYPQYHDWSLKALLAYNDTFPPKLALDIRKYGGGVYNHEIYFDSMIPGGKAPNNTLLNQIKKSFLSFRAMHDAVKTSALNVFGSGYTWLVCNGACGLQVVNTANQDTPPLTIVSPIVCIDMWEHSYYLQYKTEKENYIENWFNVVNWDKICDLLSCINNRTNL